MIDKNIHRLKWFLYRCIRKFFKINIKINRLNGEKILSKEETQEFIARNILRESDDGFFVGRFGSNELSAFIKFDESIGSFEGKRKVLKRLENGAGFFLATEETARKFALEMQEACGEIDMLGIWRPMEDYVMKKYGNNVKYCRLAYIEPYYSQNPWSKSLKGKKVLVIHPFAESIKIQYYNNREKLFDNPDILPEFDLNVLKAVQTIAGNRDERFLDWFEALDYMEKEAMKIDFDVAIIGCGAYGFPLAARLKKHGKIAIHMGGATQILFGIKGKRWEGIPEVKRLFNEYWIRPSEEETPQNVNSVEQACYW